MAFISAIHAVISLPDPNGPCHCTVKVHPYNDPCACGSADCVCTTSDKLTMIMVDGGQYKVIIEDGRDNPTIALDDEELGVIAKLITFLNLDAVKALENYSAIMSRGLVIVFQDGVEYNRFNALSGNTIGANFNELNNEDDTMEGTGIKNAFRTAIDIMVGM